jgi:mycothiol synthase
MSFILRPPEPEDTARLVALLNACDVHDVGHADSDAEDIVWRWRTPEFSTELDAWVALTDPEREILGYAWAFEGEIEVHVHPAHRGKALGTRLLQAAEQRARRQAGSDAGGDLSLRQTVSARIGAARRLLPAAGYVQTHHYARMSIRLTGPPPAPSWPATVKPRTYEVGADEQRVHDLVNLAWADYASTGWEPEPFERWMERTAGADFDPSLWFLAEGQDGLTGLSLCLDYPDMGWIAHLGVHPSWRRRGLGRALLEHSFAEYYRRGRTTVQLTVSSRNVASARRLYERVGMNEVLRYDSYIKKVAAREEGPSRAPRQCRSLKSVNTSRAALAPGAPVTPPPGCAPDPHR